METLCQQLSSWTAEVIAQLYPELPSLRVEMTPATSRQFGHYQCNQAMKLAAPLKRAPREIAVAVAKELQARYGQQLAQVEVAGPGFINFTFSDAYLCYRAAQIPTCRLRAGERVLIDFSSPNTAKEMHVGHLRSTLIGDCLARIYEYLGYEVLRINHIGDWGTQFGMLIGWLVRNLGRERLERALSQTEPLEWDLSFLMRAYQQSKLLFDSDREFEREAKGYVVALQSHDPFALSLWKQICAISRKAYQQIYDRLGVRLEECGESFYNPMLAPMVEELTQAGQITLSEGAKCIFVEGYDLPLMVQKSDGGFNYDSTDLAAIRYRAQQLKVGHIIYVTDAGQRLHFELLFAAARQVGYLPEQVKVSHVPFGLVLGPDGKKFKTRSGHTEKLIDLIEAAVDRARSILQERGESEQLEGLASALGINAIKYADLSNYRMSDYSFSYDKMLRFEGNTAAFLMYAYVRCQAILRRLGEGAPQGVLQLSHPSERQLLLRILQFDEALEQTLVELAPSRLADYLWNLAQDFNAFFRDCRVEGSEQQASRLELVKLCSHWLGQGLDLLGLQRIERM